MGERRGRKREKERTNIHLTTMSLDGLFDVLVLRHVREGLEWVWVGCGLRVEEAQIIC